MAERGRDHRGVEHTEAGSAELLGHEAAHHAEPGQLLPRVAIEALAGVAQLAHARDRQALGEEAPHGVVEQALLVRECEVHYARGSRGMPRPRSAMMFFWICAVPPPMISPSWNIQWNSQRPPSRARAESR